MIPMGTPSFKKNKDIKLKGSEHYTGLKHGDIFTYLVIECKDGIKLLTGQLDTLQTQSLNWNDCDMVRENLMGTFYNKCSNIA